MTGLHTSSASFPQEIGSANNRDTGGLLAAFDTQRTGRMGELVAELELLRRGWITGNFNHTTMNSAGWDLFATKGDQTVRLRVKAKRPGVANFRWSAKADGTVFLGNTGAADDFVVAVSFDGVGGHVSYVVPTAVVSRTLEAEHRRWLEGKKRGGGVRKDTPMRSIYIDDRDDDAPSHGFARHWAPYRNAWELLELAGHDQDGQAHSARVSNTLATADR